MRSQCDDPPVWSFPTSVRRRATGCPFSIWPLRIRWLPPAVLPIPGELGSSSVHIQEHWCSLTAGGPLWGDLHAFSGRHASGLPGQLRWGLPLGPFPQLLWWLRVGGDRTDSSRQVVTGHPSGSPWPQESASYGLPQWGGHQQQQEEIWFLRGASLQCSPLHLRSLGQPHHWRVAGGTLPSPWHLHSPPSGSQSPQSVPWIQLCHSSDFTGHGVVQGGKWEGQGTDLHHSWTRHHYALIHQQVWPGDRHSPASLAPKVSPKSSLVKLRFCLFSTIPASTTIMPSYKEWEPLVQSTTTLSSTPKSPKSSTTGFWHLGSANSQNKNCCCCVLKLWCPIASEAQCTITPESWYPITHESQDKSLTYKSWHPIPAQSWHYETCYSTAL